MHLQAVQMALRVQEAFCTLSSPAIPIAPMDVVLIMPCTDSRWQSTFDPAIVAANTALNAGRRRSSALPPHIPDPTAAAATTPLTNDSTAMDTDPTSPTPASPVSALARQRTPSIGGTSRSASFSLPNQKSGRQVVGNHDNGNGEVEEEDDDEPIDPEGKPTLSPPDEFPCSISYLFL